MSRKRVMSGQITNGMVGVGDIGRISPIKIDRDIMLESKNSKDSFIFNPDSEIPRP